MLVKSFQKSSLLDVRRLFLNRSNIYLKGQTKNDDSVENSKNNPDGKIDLRGNENFENLNDQEKASSYYLQKKYSYFSLYHFFSFFLSNNMAKSIGNFYRGECVSSGQYQLPKIIPGSIPVYDSLSRCQSQIMIKKASTILASFNLIFLVPAPTVSLLLFVPALFIFYTSFLKISNKRVTKMELLTNTEELVYQNINIFGNIKTQRVKIGSLEFSTVEGMTKDDNFSQRSVRGLINKEIGFRIKQTNQVLLFDSQAIWHEQGVNHPLLL